MGKHCLKKKLKITAGERLENPFNSKKRKKNKAINNEGVHKADAGKKKNKSPEEKRRRQETQSRVDAEEVGRLRIDGDNILDRSDKEKKKRKVLRNKKRKDDEIIEATNGNVEKRYNGVEDEFEEQNGANEAVATKKSKSKKKRRKNEMMKNAGTVEVGEPHDGIDHDSSQQNGNIKMDTVYHEAQGLIESSEGRNGADISTNPTACKSKKTRKIKNTDLASSGKEKVLEKRDKEEQEGVYEISSGDEDSRGMRKWIMEYNQSRPGLKVLQQRIDDYITAYEAKQEEERKEREAQAAEGGWTVVVHHKGRKKTTDTESGIAVGSVAQAAVLDKMTNKKSKEVGLDFYRFQKREAHRNEVMMLQSKFEQDKKRIQQLRAARKFRPY